MPMGTPSSPAVASGSYQVSVQTTIQANLESYPPSMRRIADVVVGHPHGVLVQTISELARECSTSETSVVRFCRTLGFTGYGPFRLHLATELATESARAGVDPGLGADIDASDSLADAVAKIAAAETLGIQETAAALDLAAVQRVADAIGSAGKIVIFGVGASQISARDLAQKLLRINRPAHRFVDAHEAVVTASLMSSADVAIAFSHSGRTTECHEVLRAARRQKALTVAVTNTDDSPVVSEADEVLRTAVRETTFRSGAMASRIAQLTIVDYLFIAVARRNYQVTLDALRSTHASVGGLRDDR